MEELHPHNDDQVSRPTAEEQARHVPLSVPLQQTADALQVAAASMSTLDADIKLRQRSHLMSLASSSIPTSAPEPSPSSSQAMPPKTVTPSPRRSWFAWAGGFAAVAVVAVLAISVAKFLPGMRTLSPGKIEFGQLLIPEARAADAFHLYAEKSDKAGMDADSAFIVQSKVALTAEQLKQTVRVLPAVEFTVEAKDDRTFRVQPKEPLKPGTVYKIALATKVEKPDGSTQTRDFSWALQTKNDLRILSMIPADQASRVPVNTGIEFKFTYPDVKDLTPFFSITPKVDGKFEAHGRSIAFVPKEPLKPGTKYQVTLKKGVQVKESQLTLAEDTVIRFETDEPPKVERPKPRFFVGEFEEVAPGKDIIISSGYGYGYTGSEPSLASSTIEVTGYALSPQETRDLLKQRLAIPMWAPIESSRFVEYRNLAKNQAFQVSVVPRQGYSYGPYTVTLPKVDRTGQYAIRFLPKDGEESWMLLQVTNNAIYSIGDKDELVLWTVNASTQKPLSNLPILASTSSLRTDDHGIARLSIGLFATSTNTPTSSQDYIMMEIGEPSDTYFFFKPRSAFSGYYQYSWGASQMYDHWSYLFIDRPIYRPSDELGMYGFIQNRNSQQGAGEVTLKLQKQGWWWFDFFGREKVYQEQVVKTDAAGHFQTQFKWSDLAAGYYQVNAYIQDQMVGSRFFEVRDFVKPAFSIEVKTDAGRVYAGDVVTGTIDVRFYDGTPLAKGTFDVQFNSSYGSSQATTTQLITDESGRARFSLPTEKFTCDMTTPDGSCPFQEYRNITVRSAVGEEAEIVGSATVDVFGSSLSIDMEPHTSGTDARIDVMTAHVDFTKDDFRGASWGGRTLKGFVIGHSWKQIEDGTYYDFFEKKTYPRYRYEQVRDTPTELQLTTDTSGRASYSFKMEGKKWYDIILLGADDQGRSLRFTRSVAIGWYDRYEDTDRVYNPEYPVDDRSANLGFLPEKGDIWSPGVFKQDDQVTVQFQHGKQSFDTTKTAGTLFITASRGIRTVQHINSPQYQFSFNRDLIPNASIRGVAFVNNRFEIARRELSLELDSRMLDIEAKPIQSSYLPGSEVKVHVILKKKGTDERVGRAKVAFAAVDKALEGVAYFAEEIPLNMLYGYVPDGIVSEGSSHQLGAQDLSNAGAEKGGGGGGPDAKSIRRSFKDTAAYGLVETDQNGEADIVFKVPDNLTTWRIQLASITNDVLAGAKLIEVPVTKSIFVDVVAPPKLLTKDKPVLKLRAYGVGLQPKESVSFTVDAPTLGVVNQTVNGQAFEPLYIAVDKLVPGRHAVVMRVTTPKGTDALERILDIADTRYFKDEQVVIDAIPGAALPELGTEEVDLTFSSKAQASLLPDIRNLSYYDWSARVDAKIVSRMMRHLLQDLFKESQPLSPEESLQAYLDPDGGIRLLPYASVDTELTAEVAATAPELFDQNAMKGYFYKVLDDPGATRELQIAALSGLAALSEPVLLQLQAMASQTDLGWRERLVIARGLMAAGDQDGSRMQLETLLKNATRRDNTLSIAASDKQADIYEATADAAALAAQLAHPEAADLQRFVRENWSRDAFPLLAKARYLVHVAPLTPINKVTLDYTVDGKTERRVNLTEYPIETVKLTKEEIRAFRVIRVEGPLSISYVKRVPGRPESQPEVAVSRSYQTERPLDQLQDGDTVRITLKAEWQDKAQDGCYALRDHLPGALQPVLDVRGYEQGSKIAYPYNVTDREVSYVVCKYDPQHSITYLARVVSRGAYVAEAPSLQHLQFPSVSAIGTDQTIIVK